MVYPEINVTTFNQGHDVYNRPKGYNAHARGGRGKNHSGNYFCGRGC